MEKHKIALRCLEYIIVIIALIGVARISYKMGYLDGSIHPYKESKQ